MHQQQDYIMLTNAEIFEQLDREINPDFYEQPEQFEEENRERETFSVDYDAKTLLWYDENEDEWNVNGYRVEFGIVIMDSMPTMTFPGDSL